MVMVVVLVLLVDVVVVMVMVVGVVLDGRGGGLLCAVCVSNPGVVMCLFVVQWFGTTLWCGRVWTGYGGWWELVLWLLGFSQRLW